MSFEIVAFEIQLFNFVRLSVFFNELTLLTDERAFCFFIVDFHFFKHYHCFDWCELYKCSSFLIVRQSCSHFSFGFFELKYLKV